MCIGRLFSSPDPPELPPVPPPPAPPRQRPAQDQGAARQRQRQLAAYATTRSDRIATSSRGLASEADVGRARLLGQTA